MKFLTILFLAAILALGVFFFYEMKPVAGVNPNAAAAKAGSADDQQYEVRPGATDEEAVSSETDNQTAKAHSGHATTPHSPAPEDLEPLLKDWGVPKVAFLVSGQQYGYFEPCGCSEEQYGGFTRRGDLAKKMTEKGWTVAGLDLGGLVKHTRDQTADKFKTMSDGLRDLNYAAVGVGPEELRLGPEVLLLVDPEELPFVCCNILFFGARETGIPLLSKTVEINGVKIGITAVYGDSFVKKVSPNPEFYEFLPLKKSLKEALAEIEKEKPDLRVLLAHAEEKETEALIGEFPDFDFVLTHTDLEEGESSAKKIGNTTLLAVGHKGKHTGVVGYYPNADEKFKFELVKLDRHRFKDDPRMVEHMRIYQDQLKGMARADLTPVAHMSGSKFVGAEACAECHEQAYEIWKKTPHATAFESLDPAHKGRGHERLKGINRTFDPECLSCHVTGWDAQEVLRFAGGFVNEEFANDDEERKLSKILKGNQCENCHGPGSRHIELINEGEDAKAIKFVKVTLEQSKAATGCYKCHDIDNSPNFDFDSYWEEVKHYESDE